MTAYAFTPKLEPKKPPVKELSEKLKFLLLQNKQNRQGIDRPK